MLRIFLHKNREHVFVFPKNICILPILFSVFYIFLINFYEFFISQSLGIRNKNFIFENRMSKMTLLHHMLGLIATETTK